MIVKTGGKASELSGSASTYASYSFLYLKTSQYPYLGASLKRRISGDSVMEVAFNI